MNFPIPKQYQAPEGVKEGEEFQEIGTFKFVKGNMTLVSLGEKEIPLESKKPKGGKQAIQEKLDSTEDGEGSEMSA